ncbi:MAG TPA: PIG-L family deacetylase [Verrucomicrobiae bacterium]|nr:PIG-L family deacetylase [Verrucomicrobiae bacterium]
MRFGVVIAVLLAVVTPAFAQQEFPPITPEDRIVVVAPHPDDEVLGAGGIMQQACAVGAEVHVVYLTNGDHNQFAFKLYKLRLHLNPTQYLFFGNLREREATAATEILGLSPDQLTFLGFPDYGTMSIWRDYWRAQAPFRSDATLSNAVPYEDAYRFGQSYTPESATADLVELFRRWRPTRVFVTHPADTNPDHRAAANFVRLAVLEISVEQPPPAIDYYIIHFGRWPAPYHYHPDMVLKPPRQLLEDGDWFSVPLTPEQTERKYAAIIKNRTELTTREYYLVSFARANEIFATLGILPVPIIPANEVIDWRKAVHTKVISFGETDSLFRPDMERLFNQELAAMELEETAYVRQGDDLIAQVTLRNRLGKRANVHLRLYGYRQGEDFAVAPKIHINVTPLGSVHVFDGRHRLKERSVTVTSVSNHLIVRLPISLLGSKRPDYLFAATRANLGEVAADDTAWHLFSLSNGPETVHTMPPVTNGAERVPPGPKGPAVSGE